MTAPNFTPEEARLIRIIGGGASIAELIDAAPALAKTALEHQVLLDRVKTLADGLEKLGERNPAAVQLFAPVIALLRESVELP